MASKFGKLLGSTPDQPSRKSEHAIGSYPPLSAKGAGDPFVESKKVALQIISEVKSLSNQYPETIPPDALDPIRNGILECIKAQTPHLERKNRELIRGKIGSDILAQAQNSKGFGEKAAIKPHLIAMELVTDHADAQLASALYFLYAAVYSKGGTLDLSANGKFDPLPNLKNTYAIWDEYNHKRSLRKSATEGPSKFSKLITPRPTAVDEKQSTTKKRPTPEFLDDCMETVEKFLVDKDKDPEHQDAIMKRGLLITRSRSELKQYHDVLVRDMKTPEDQQAVLVVMEHQKQTHEAQQADLLRTIFKSDEMVAENDEDPEFLATLKTTLDDYFSNRSQIAILERSIASFHTQEADGPEHVDLLSETAIKQLEHLLQAKELLEILEPLKRSVTRLLGMATPTPTRVHHLNEQVQQLTAKWSHEIKKFNKPEPIDTEPEAVVEVDEKPEQKTGKPSPKKTLHRIQSALFDLEKVVENLQLEADKERDRLLTPSKFGGLLRKKEREV